ncbi:alanine--tRNA ligase-related protein [Lysinibacillus fusiformis]
MKDLLYYQDVMLREFDAHIISKETDEFGRHYVVLSNTAFYPTGGGQPHDTGTLNGIEVIDVEKVGEEIRHYMQGHVSELEGFVHGTLNCIGDSTICSNMLVSIF